MERIHQAYLIWQGGGMSIKGVRTCGDYMFSGHTVVLTLLNFFITECTSFCRNILKLLTFFPSPQTHPRSCTSCIRSLGCSISLASSSSSRRTSTTRLTSLWPFTLARVSFSTTTRWQTIGPSTNRTVTERASGFPFSTSLSHPSTASSQTPLTSPGGPTRGFSSATSRPSFRPVSPLASPAFLATVASRKWASCHLQVALLGLAKACKTALGPLGSLFLPLQMKTALHSLPLRVTLPRVKEMHQTESKWRRSDQYVHFTTHTHSPPLIFVISNVITHLFPFPQNVCCYVFSYSETPCCCLFCWCISNLFCLPLWGCASVICVFMCNVLFLFPLSWSCFFLFSSDGLSLFVWLLKHIHTLYTCKLKLTHFKKFILYALKEQFVWCNLSFDCIVKTIIKEKGETCQFC